MSKNNFTKQDYFSEIIKTLMNKIFYTVLNNK